MLRILILSALFIYSFALNAQLNVNGTKLDDYIKKGIEDWKIPGLAIVIVKDGKVILRKGYGVKDIKTKEAVTESTNFFIASNSKLFTGLALSKLDFEKKLSLNDKITKYYPEFKLNTPLLTQEVTIKDMLTHRIGTKTFQGDFTFWNSSLSASEVMGRMQLLKPVNAFRDAYGYCNSCYLTAGMVIPKVTGKSWEEYIETEFLKPLKMERSYASIEGRRPAALDMATPYSSGYTHQLNKVPYDRWTNMAPAAAIISNVKDLTHWLEFQLDSGRFEGQRIMPWSVLQKTRDVQIITGSRKSAAYPIHYRGYGLGVFSCDYNGRQVYWHTGGAGGMLSNVCFVPEEKLGIAILTNNDNQNFFEMLRYQILDMMLGVPNTDRSKIALEQHNADMENQIAEIQAWKKLAKENEISNSDELEKYVGRYEHELYGTIDVSIVQNVLEVRFNSHDDLNARMMYLGKEEWILEYNNILYGIFKTNFSFNDNKTVKSLFIKMNEFVEMDAYEFIKK